MAMHFDNGGSKNIVRVCIWLESGCSLDNGEYGLTMEGVIGALNIMPNGGVDDVSLIRECAEEFISGIDFEIPGDGLIELMMIESGELQDVFYTKWYEVKSHRIQDFNK